MVQSFIGTHSKRNRNYDARFEIWASCFSFHTHVGCPIKQKMRSKYSCGSRYGGGSIVKGGSKALAGGLVRNVSGMQVIALVLALFILHSILAILMWTNVIEFATNDTKIAVATTLTVAAVLLGVYLLFLVTSESY